MCAAAEEKLRRDCAADPELTGLATAIARLRSSTIGRPTLTCLGSYSSPERAPHVVDVADDQPDDLLRNVLRLFLSDQSQQAVIPSRLALKDAQGLGDPARPDLSA